VIRLIRVLRRGRVVERERDGAFAVNEGGLIGGEQPGAVSLERTPDREAGLDAPVPVFWIGHVLGPGRVVGHPAEGRTPAGVE
jgi:hypothetical protein